MTVGSEIEAMVLTERDQLRAQRFPRPRLGPDDGLLRVELAGICHTDVDILDGSLAGCGVCRYCVSGNNRFCGDAVGYGTSTSANASRTCSGPTHR